MTTLRFILYVVIITCLPIYIVAQTVGGNNMTGIWVPGSGGGGGGESPLTFQQSLSRVGNVINLTNDSTSPGNSKYYGTNASGTKGFFDLTGGALVADPGIIITGGNTIGVDFGVVPGLAATNTFTGTNSFGGAAGVIPWKTGTAVPGTCTVGQGFFDTDAPAGQNIYACTATNTWTAQGGTGVANGGTGFSAVSSLVYVHNAGHSNIIYSCTDDSSPPRPIIPDSVLITTTDITLQFGATRTGFCAFSSFGGSASFDVISTGTNTTATMTMAAGSNWVANNASRTAPSKSGTSLPGTCTVGDTYIKTDATASQVLHVCTATNTWTQQGGASTITDTHLFSASGWNGGPGIGHNLQSNSAVPGGACDDANGWCYWTFPDATTKTVVFKVPIPTGWTGNIPMEVRAWQNDGGSGDAVWSIQTGCTTASNSTTTTYNSAQTLTTTLTGASAYHSASINLTTTGCAAGDIMRIKMSRSTSDSYAFDAKFESAIIKVSHN